MRKLVVGVAVAVALVGGLLLFANWFSGGGLFSRPSEDWTIEVQASGPGSWIVAVPAIVAREVGAIAEALDELYDDMSVETGAATFGREGPWLVIRGEGHVNVSAGRVGRPSAFGGWAAEDLNVTRRDAEGPPTTVVWRAEFSGGKGHTCWADAVWTVGLAAGETRSLVEAGHLNLPGRPWNTVCA